MFSDGPRKGSLTDATSMVPRAPANQTNTQHKQYDMNVVEGSDAPKGPNLIMKLLSQSSHQFARSPPAPTTEVQCFNNDAAWNTPIHYTVGPALWAPTIGLVS